MKETSSKETHGKTTLAAFGALAMACCAALALVAVGAGTVLATLARFLPLTVLGVVLLVIGLSRLAGVRPSAGTLGSRLVSTLRAADRGLTMVGSQCCVARSTAAPTRSLEGDREMDCVDPAAPAPAGSGDTMAGA